MERLSEKEEDQEEEIERKMKVLSLQDVWFKW